MTKKTKKTKKPTYGQLAEQLETANIDIHRMSLAMEHGALRMELAAEAIRELRHDGAVLRDAYESIARVADHATEGWKAAKDQVHQLKCYIDTLIKALAREQQAASPVIPPA